jgi:hypothetical protein
MIAGISLGVGLALSTQPTNFTQAASYYQISTQNAVSYVVQFKQSARNDGLFATGPYNTSATTQKPDASAKSLNNQYATAIATATTPTGNWVKVQLTNGKQYWIDARGVQTVSTYAVAGQTSATGLAILNQAKRNDGLFINGPYRTSATTMKADASAKAFNGQGAEVLATETTSTGKWAQVRLANGKTYWIDTLGLSLTNQNQITNQVTVRKTAVLNQSQRSDGLFIGGPYKTIASSIKPVANAKSKNGTGVNVIATATAGGVNWAEIQLGNSNYWIDARGISYFNLAPITSQANANSRAIVSESNRSDGLFTNGPYHSSLTTLKPVASAKSLNGQVVEVSAHATTALGNWSRIKAGNGKTYWMDSQGLKATNYYMISNQKKLNKTAQISQGSRNDGMFANGPYKTSSSTTKANASARSYNGQTVTVIASASTETGNWVRVKLSNGKTYWLDARGVKYTIFHDWTKPSQSFAYPNVSNYSGINIEVNLSKQEVYIKRNNKVLYTMYCSSGKNGATPTGHYQIQAERGSVFWEGNIGARWYTSWKGHGIYLFHSVLIDRNYHYIPSESKWLGIKPISHGCIRMSGPDAKWINEHMKVGTKLYIHN